MAGGDADLLSSKSDPIDLSSRLFRYLELTATLRAYSDSASVSGAVSAGKERVQIMGFGINEPGHANVGI